MKKDPMPFWMAVFLLIAGLLLGAVFTFGQQYWNAQVTPDQCTEVQTRFLDYHEHRKIKSVRIHEISVDCANGERYFIDGASVNERVRDALAFFSPGDEIRLLIHPNRSIIVEFTTESRAILSFDDTMEKLRDEAKGFLPLGIFMYFGAVVGLYYMVLHWVQKYRNGK